MSTEATAMLQAAEAALERYAYDEVQQLAEQALAVLPPDAITERARCTLLAADAASYAGDFRYAEERFLLAANLYHGLKDALGQLRCRIGQARCAVRRGDLGQARHLAGDVLAEARKGGHGALEAEALAVTGNALWKQGDGPGAVTELRQALAKFEALRMPVEANYTRGSLGVALVMAGQMDESAVVSKRALTYFRERGDVRSVAKLLTNLGFVAFAQGAYGIARSYLKRCEQLETELNDRSLVMTTNFNLGLLELQENQAREAKKPLTRAYHLAQELGDLNTEGSALMYLGVVAVYEGLPDEAQNYLDLSETRFAGQLSDEALLRELYRPVVALASGDTAAARELWLARPALASYGAYQDDFRNVRMLLEFLLSEAGRQELHLTDEAIALATTWLGELQTLQARHQASQQAN